MGFRRFGRLRIVAIAAGFMIAAGALMPSAAAAAETGADNDFAKRMFAGHVPAPTAYACFVRHYDAAHLAAHPLQKVSAMKLLISTEKDPDFAEFQYAFRLGVNFRTRRGFFNSSGNCGHAPTVEDPADANIPAADRVKLPEGIDFQCAVDCDGGGISVSLADAENASIVKLDHVRIWKGNDPDSESAGALEAGADDKEFRLDRTDMNECAPLATDRKELAAMRRNR